MRTTLASSLVLLLALGAAADDAKTLDPSRDGIVLAADARVEPGTWVVAERDGEGVIRIRTDGVTLDLGGATLRGAPEGTDPDGLTGVGILVEGARGVTIRNGRVAGFKVGVRAVSAPDLVIEGLDASGNFRQRLRSTPEAEDASDWLWPHENDANEWEERYGGGLSLTDCEGAAVRGCRVRQGQNGLLMTRCTKGTVIDNDFSFGSGWGVALYRTTRTEVSHNRLDFCVRGYSHGVYYRGQDSAAILVFEQSSHNVFAHNSATHSGDGFFLYAGHETTRRTGGGGSNFNQVFANDFRFAVANGIEATFSEGNVFAGNDCSGSDHGIWAGYSRNSVFRNNTARDCMTAGVSIEHGNGNVLVGNDLRGARTGIHLWWDDDADLLASAYGTTQDCTSSRNVIRSNRLQGTKAALRLQDDRGSAVVDNVFLPGADGASVVALDPGTVLGAFRDNRFEGTRRIDGDLVLEKGPSGPVAAPPAEAEPELAGTQDVSLPADFPVGRASIRIDEWGPVPPGETRLFPATVDAAGPAARLHLLGSEPFTVQGVEGAVTVAPREGKAPATLVVRAAPGSEAIVPFAVTVAAGGTTCRAAGTLLVIPWQVRWFTWSDEQDPLARPGAFARLLDGPPRAARDVDALDFPWRSGGPEGLPPDRFATLATARPTLPAGRYRLRTTSDDGVRLFVDGKRVLERWNRHGPTEDVVTLDLDAGPHDLRVEHFEIDGWSWLALRVDRRR